MWLVIIAWIVGLVCIFVMKKIRPDEYIAYAIYVLVILGLLTTFVTLYICQ